MKYENIFMEREEIIVSWEEVIAFIQKWWLEFALGGGIAVVSGIARHYWKLTKQVKSHEDEEKKQLFKDELTSEVKTLMNEVRRQVREDIDKESAAVRAEIELESSQVREEMAIYETNDGQRITALEGRANILEDTLTAVVSSLDAIKGGLLAVQGHEFRSKCRRLLAQDTIKPSEYEQLESDHDAYNGLGGNHKGDSLFDQVKTKYYAQLKQ